MDIRVTSTNKIFYQIDSGLAALLCEAFPASFEPVNRTAKPHPANAPMPNYAKPQWGVGHGATGDPTITLKTGRTELFYVGSPAGAVGHFKKAGFDLPQEIFTEYTRLVETPLPSVTLSDQDIAKYAR